MLASFFDRIRPPQKEQLPSATYLKMSDAEMLTYLKKFLPNFPQELWGQLQHLDTPAIGRSRLTKTEANTHTGYELEMVRIVLAYGKELEAYFFDTDNTVVSFGMGSISRQELIPSLCSMILMSDIGKAGDHLLRKDESSPILNMYTDVIMDRRHSEWLQKTSKEGYPEDLQPIILSLSKELKKNQQIFEMGNFAVAPIRLALYCANQVAREAHPEMKKDPITVDDSLMEALVDIGMDIDRTPMAEFWTKAHLICGERLFASTINDKKSQGLALLSLFHHFSQPGALPADANRITLADPRTMELIAFMEIMDKLDANCHRSNIGKDAIVPLTVNMILPLLKNQQNKTAYQKVFEFIQQQNIVNALFRDAPRRRE